MGNKKRFLKLVSGDDTKTLEEIQHRIKNREAIKGYQRLAIQVLSNLDRMGLTPEWLAQQIGEDEARRVTSGKEQPDPQVIDRLRQLGLL